MSRQIYKLKLDQVIHHTPNVRELILSTAEGQNFEFKAGQFAMLHVPQETGKPALRAYSIASSDAQKNGFKLLFKYVENGVASKFVWNLKGGETLDFTGPFGKVFFKEPPTEQIIFLNTGTGLSQHLCYLLSKKEQYPNLKYRMLFGVRNESEIYFKKELDQLTSELPDFKYEFVLSRPSDSWTGKKGYVQHFIEEFSFTNIESTFYLCGNGGMIKEVQEKLEAAGFDKTRVHKEAFD